MKRVFRYGLLALVLAVFFALSAGAAAAEASCEILGISSVTDMTCMFSGCYVLEKLDISGFNTSRVTSMNSMFENCRALTLLDLSDFQTDLVTDMYRMFFCMEKLQTIYASDGFVIDALTEDADESMFWNCTALKGGAGTAYSEEHVDSAYAHVDGGPADPGYFTAK